MAIAAIETRYAGCRFRSRLEARWAVLMDHLEMEWQYEPEGFETAAGRYLPDFYLPQHKRWIEIKGGSFTKRDRARGEAFAEQRWQVGEGYRVFIGDIPRKPVAGPAGLPIVPCLVWTMAVLPVDGMSPEVIKDFADRRAGGDWTAFPHPAFGPGDYLDWDASARELARSFWMPATSMEQMQDALTAARSARFEHGERG